MRLLCFSISPDPTFTVENVTKVMEKVKIDKRKQVWENVLGWDVFLERSHVEEIYSSHSSENERLHSGAYQYVCKPDSSWEELVQCLYGQGEMAVVKKAKHFLQQKGV